MADPTDLTRADVTRARLLQAATAAFAEKGFHGTATRDIATAAGMSQAAVYFHHKSKEELLYLISRKGHEDTLLLVRDAIASSDVPAQALRRLVHDFVVDHAQGHTGARIVNYELAALTAEHYEEIRGIRRSIQFELRELIERGVEAGDFDTPDPEVAAVALLSLGIDIARWYRDEGAWSPDYIAERYADIALRVVGAN